MTKDQPPAPVSDLPPGAFHAVHRAARALLVPVDRFLSIESASGIVLIAAAVLALLWANSPWQASYHALWHTSITFGIGTWVVQPTLHFLVNDVLMVVFFFVVGLEIKREVASGELRDMRRAALPLAAALGGMLLPAGLYLAIAGTAPGGAAGWGVPMATDIAFAVGVLTLLGSRVSPALRIMLLALAIIDDLGAILVIALFYSDGIRPGGLGIAMAGVFGVRLFKWLAVRSPWLYLLPGALIWGGVLYGGVHPTIAGVVLGLLTPMRPWFGRRGFVDVTRAALAEATAHLDDRHEFLAALARIDVARREALSPGERLEHALHPWVAYVVMPVFAFASAGVSLGAIDLGAPGATAILAGIVVGLVAGKAIGIFTAAWLAVRAGVGSLPPRVDGRGLLVVGAVGGIGFTMSLFIASLAFPDPARLAVARLAVLIASVVAAGTGLGLGRLLLRR